MLGAGWNAFDCGSWKGDVHMPNTYSAVIDDLGVDVDKWDATGRRDRLILEYENR
jgi:hypothetical protein